MTPERWQQIDALYVAAKERKPDERSAFLAEACGEDSELRDKVESMLAQDGSAAGILDLPMEGLLAGVSEPRSFEIPEGTHLGPYRSPGALAVSYPFEGVHIRVFYDRVRPRADSEPLRTYLKVETKIETSSCRV
jgi:hypothetical protein